MLPEKYKALSDEQTLPLISKAKNKLGNKVLVLAHHYQRDEVIEFADKVGDSLNLSQYAADSDSKYIVFCGVRFMAETADMVTDDNKTVILPDLSAGCPMADMAPFFQIEQAWDELSKVIDIKKVIPITYINSSAETKAFCGKNNGLVCTSANAQSIIEWAFNQNKQIFFFPDRYLSTNIANKLGLNEDQITLWDRNFKNGNLSDIKIKNSKILVWNGYCPVHARFKGKDIDILRKQNPDIKILVHPEVPESVAQKADYMGSTNFIVKKIENARPGTHWAIGTEIHLVSRLAKKHPDKNINLIGTPICMCSMMDRISPGYLLWILDELNNGSIKNQIKVKKNIKKDALKALHRMFELS